MPLWCGPRASSSAADQQRRRLLRSIRDAALKLCLAPVEWVRAASSPAPLVAEARGANSKSVFLPLPPGWRGALHARVVLSVLAFHHRQPYRVVPVVGSLSGLSDRRSPVEAVRSVVCVALVVKELVDPEALLRACFVSMSEQYRRYCGWSIPPVILFSRGDKKPAQRRA